MRLIRLPFPLSASLKDALIGVLFDISRRPPPIHVTDLRGHLTNLSGDLSSETGIKSAST